MDKEEIKKTIGTITQDNTQKIYRLGGLARKILGFIEGETFNELAEAENAPTCLYDEIKLQEKELIEIIETLEKAEKILG